MAVTVGDVLSFGRFLCKRSFSFSRRRPDPSACATARSDVSATPTCRTSAVIQCRWRCSPTPLFRWAQTYRCDRSRPPSPPDWLSASISTTLWYMFYILIVIFYIVCRAINYIIIWIGMFFTHLVNTWMFTDPLISIYILCMF